MPIAGASLTIFLENLIRMWSGATVAPSRGANTKRPSQGSGRYRSEGRQVGGRIDVDGLELPDLLSVFVDDVVLAPIADVGGREHKYYLPSREAGWTNPDGRIYRSAPSRGARLPKNSIRAPLQCCVLTRRSIRGCSWPPATTASDEGPHLLHPPGGGPRGDPVDRVTRRPTPPAALPTSASEPWQRRGRCVKGWGQVV